MGDENRKSGDGCGCGCEEIHTAAPDPGMEGVTKADGTEECGCSRHLTVDFSTFVLSLATQALIQLGEVKHPEITVESPRVEEARQTIDILCMLEAKTKGNLEQVEARLLESVLYDVRMKYVDVARKVQNRPAGPAEHP